VPHQPRRSNSALAALSVLPVAWVFGLHNQYWRFAGLRDLLAVLARAEDE
jgi:hypothetical protein